MLGWGGSVSKPGKRVPGRCEGMREETDGRPGADFLKIVGKSGFARYSF